MPDLMSWRAERERNILLAKRSGLIVGFIALVAWMTPPTKPHPVAPSPLLTFKTMHSDAPNRDPVWPTGGSPVFPEMSAPPMAIEMPLPPPAAARANTLRRREEWRDEDASGDRDVAIADDPEPPSDGWSQPDEDPRPAARDDYQQRRAAWLDAVNRDAESSDSEQ